MGKFYRSTSGAAGFEYAVFAGLIAVIVVVGVSVSDGDNGQDPNRFTQSQQHATTLR